ncbi:MAG: endonuclease/exonuclease/phosphatase family protein [Planctomycetota bacterium]
MDVLLVISILLAVALAIATAVAETSLPHWAVRMCDFPRLQILVLALVTAGGFGVAAPFNQWWTWVVLGVLVAVMVRQAWWIVPYVPGMPREVASTDRDATLCVVISNVLMPNDDHERWRQVIGACDADVVAVAENDRRWTDAIDELLGESHPHKHAEPLDNLYGMAIWSRLPTRDVSIEHIVQDDIPSIHGTLTLGDGRAVRFHCVHPRPPVPAEYESSVPRDAELVLVGRRVAEQRASADSLPTIVMGDLNDVAWSRTTQLFRRISGLLDPRRGRGFFNSFHAHRWWFRCPLDHVFVSPEFRVGELRRLPHVGSDHFPMLVRLRLEANASHAQDPPQPDAADLADAQLRLEREEADSSDG